MEIIKKIIQKSKNLYSESVPAIAFFGDSVTQGCYEIYMQEDNSIGTVVDQDSVYSTHLSKLFKTLFPDIPVCMINAGISGDDVIKGAERLERDVLRFQPDLTVVAFGLNDCMKGIEHLDEYRDGLGKIFQKLKENGGQVIYLTPNMMNTYVSHTIKEPEFIRIAKDSMQLQLDGVLSSYVEAGKEAAAARGVTVCDVYKKWKLLYESGVDTTALLSNFINHPTREMHKMTAYELMETILQ